MLWRGRRESDNVEDQRGMGGKLIAGGGIGTVILAVVVALLGGDPSVILRGSGPAPSGVQAPRGPEEEERKQFVSVVLADTEDVWNAQFRNRGAVYREPKLVLFTGQVQSACGFASAASGPFYCGGDQRIYIDLSFYDDLKRRYGAPGDFAQAYVIAHEVGHHIQNQMGTLDKVHAQRRRLSETEYNRLSVRLELQADFYAGVWAHHAQRMRNILDASDIPEALQAAAAIGDDRLQKQSQGYVVPESFSHGTSAQRQRWFRRGWETGDMRQGDTFNAADL